MVRIHRKTNGDARALVSEEGRAYALSPKRRELLRSQLGESWTAPATGPDASDPYALSGTEPIIDCIRKVDDQAGYVVTTGDFRELTLTPDEIRSLLGDE